MPVMKSDKNKDYFQPSLFGKMYPECSAQKITPSGVSWPDLLEQTLRCAPPQAAAGVQLVMLLDRKDKRRGESLMLNISESPNDVAVSLLSQVLEKDSIPAKYYLSARACRGILLRAQKWDYKLPPRLEKACHWMIAHESLTSPTSGDSTTKTK